MADVMMCEYEAEKCDGYVLSWIGERGVGVDVESRDHVGLAVCCASLNCASSARS